MNCEFCGRDELASSMAVIATVQHAPRAICRECTLTAISIFQSRSNMRARPADPATLFRPRGEVTVHPIR